MCDKQIQIGTKVFYVQRDPTLEKHYCFGCAPVVEIFTYDSIEGVGSFDIDNVERVIVEVDINDNGETEYRLDLNKEEFMLEITDYIIRLNQVVGNI